jgi:glycogen operon protein
MTEQNWFEGSSTISMRLAGDAIEESTALGEVMTEPSLLVVIHAGADDIEVTLPTVNRDPELTRWHVLLDTGTSTGEASASHVERSTIVVPGRTVLLMQGEV